MAGTEWFLTNLAGKFSQVGLDERSRGWKSGIIRMVF
jgi:hypothetical protein